MEKLKNKIITIEDILKIGEILNVRHKTLKAESEESDRENEGKQYGEQFYKTHVSYGEIKFSLFYGDAKDGREDFEWFKETLTKDAKNITGAAVDYSCTFVRNSATKYTGNESTEHFRIYLDMQNMGYGDLDKRHSNNEEFRAISSEIDKIIENCSPRYDKALQNRSLYRLTPSFAISAVLGLILAVALFATAKLGILPESFSTFILDNPWILIVGGIAVMLLLGLILPNPNMGMYKSLVIDRKYKSYDTNWQIEHYENDYNRYQDQVEFTVGRFYGSDKTRKKIQKNFKTSILILSVCLFAFIALAVVMFVI